MTPSCWAVLGPCWARAGPMLGCAMPCWAPRRPFKHHWSPPCAPPAAQAEGLTAAGQLGPSAGPCALWGAWARGAAGPGTPWAVPGQSPTQLLGEAPAAGYELLMANGLQQHAPPAAGRRSGPGMGAGREGTARMVGMRHQAPLRLHPEAPSSLLGHQRRPLTAGGRPDRPRPGRPDPFRAVRVR